MLLKNKDEKTFSVSKWLKQQVLIDLDEMEKCLAMLGSFDMYNVSSIATFEELALSKEHFLKVYGSYVENLKQGCIPQLDKIYFSSVITSDVESVYAIEIMKEKWVVKMARPVIQLQHHRFFVSKVDHKIHTMVMSPESVAWGLQWAFPQMFFDHHSGTYRDTKECTNAALFHRLTKWLRGASVPTTFVWKEKKIVTPLRLGKSCFTWIQRHPQLKENGITVHVY